MFRSFLFSQGKILFRYNTVTGTLGATAQSNS